MFDWCLVCWNSWNVVVINKELEVAKPFAVIGLALRVHPPRAVSTSEPRSADRAQFVLLHFHKIRLRPFKQKCSPGSLLGP